MLTETKRPEDSENSCSSSKDLDNMSGSCSCTMNSRWSLGDLKNKEKKVITESSLLSKQAHSAEH